MSEAEQGVLAPGPNAALVIAAPACIFCGRRDVLLNQETEMCAACMVIQSYHTLACLKIFRQQIRAREAYFSRWPYACLHCEVTGIISYPGSREEPPDQDPCSKCSELGLCPRCGKPGLTDENRGDATTGDGPCSFCHWDITSPGLPYVQDFCACEVRLLAGDGPMEKKQARVAPVSKCFTIAPPEGKGTTRSFCITCVNSEQRLQPLLLDAYELGILKISGQGITGQACYLCGRLIQTVTAQAQPYTVVLRFTFDEATTITATTGLEARLQALEALQRAEVTVHDKVTKALGQALSGTALRLVDASSVVDTVSNAPAEDPGGVCYDGI